MHMAYGHGMIRVHDMRVAWGAAHPWDLVDRVRGRDLIVCLALLRPHAPHLHLQRLGAQLAHAHVGWHLWLR